MQHFATSQYALVEGSPLLTTLVSVDIVCRFYRLRIPSVLAEHISDFTVFSPSCTLYAAAAEVDPRLMRLLCARSAHADDPLDQAYVASAFNKAVSAASGVGDYCRVEVFMRLFPDIVVTDAVLHAARGGHVHILRLFQDNYTRTCWGDQALYSAGCGGHLFAAQLLYRWLNIQTPEGRLICKAAAEGYRGIVEWLWPQVVADADETLQFDAIRVAPLSLAQWMVEHSLSCNTSICIDVAAERGDLAFLTWAQAHPRAAHATTKAMDHAAANGHYGTVEWLHKNRSEGCTTDAIDEAARFGHFSVVQFLVYHRHEGFTSEALCHSANEGHLDILAFLTALNLVPIPPQIFDLACKNGKLHVVAWLSRMGYGQPSFRAMDWAAESGHLDVVRFLHDTRSEGCSTNAMDGAATSGNIEMLEWIHTNRLDRCSAAATDGAAAGGHTKTLDWLRTHGLDLCTSTTIDIAARAGQLESLKWLHANSTAVGTTAAMDAAIAVGGISMVRWFHKNRPEQCTSDGFDHAIATGDFEVMEYVRREKITFCSRVAFLEAVEMERLYETAWVRQHFPSVSDDIDIRSTFSWPLLILRQVGLV